MARLKWYLDPLSPNQLKKKRKEEKKNVKKLDPSEKKLPGSAHA